MLERTGQYWSRTQIVVDEGPFWFVSAPLSEVGKLAGVIARSAGRTAALTVQATEVAFLVPSTAWAPGTDGIAHSSFIGPFAMIELNCEVPAEEPAFAAPALARLALAGVTAVHHEGRSRHHISVRHEHLDRAVAILAELIEDARAQV